MNYTDSKLSTTESVQRLVLDNLHPVYIVAYILLSICINVPLFFCSVLFSAQNVRVVVNKTSGTPLQLHGLLSGRCRRNEHRARVALSS